MKVIKFCIGGILVLVLGGMIINIGFRVGIYFRLQRELKEIQRLQKIYEEIENVPVQQSFDDYPRLQDLFGGE